MVSASTIEQLPDQLVPGNIAMLRNVVEDRHERAELQRRMVRDGQCVRLRKVCLRKLPLIPDT